MAQIQIWGGGPYHPTSKQADWLLEKLTPLGHSLRYREDRGVFSPEVLDATDLLILAGLDEASVGGAAYQPLSEASFQALKKYLETGKPLLVHHCGIISFGERDELTQIYDGRWIRNQSYHPPYQKFKVSVLGQHPATEGCCDFEIEDELYCKLVGPKKSQVLMEASWEGQAQPLAWAGNYGQAKSKILFSSLGHDMKSYTCPELQRFLLNSINWLLSKNS